MVCFENLQEDAISKFGDLDCCDVGNVKCGKGQWAPELVKCNRKVFNKMPFSKCGLLGMVRKVLKHFGQMCEGVEPNEITFVCLLPACRLAGLVDEGMHCYTSMITIYTVLAKLEHDPAWLTLLVMSIYSLYNFCKIRTLPLWFTLLVMLAIYRRQRI